MTNKSHRHRYHAELSGEHPLGHVVQIVVALSFISVWTLDSFFLNYTTQFSEYIAVFIRTPVGMALFVASAYLAIMSHKTIFGKTREQPGVTTEGVYGIVRHPMYLSELIVYLGLLLLNLSLAALVVFILAMVFFNRIARYEERLLVERFGQAYAQYMKDVPMWLPGWH